jgi:hypothetical protein
MAASPDGVPHCNMDTSGRAQYIIVDLPTPPLPSYCKDELIRSHLADNRSVLIRGQTLEGPTTFTHEDVEAYKGSLAQSVEWQGERI